MSKSSDKTLQAIIKLKDEISGPLKKVMGNMENLNKKYINCTFPSPSISFLPLYLLIQ